MRRSIRQTFMEVVEASQYKKNVHSLLNQAETMFSVATGFTIPLLPRGRVDNVLFRSQVGLRENEISEGELFSLLASTEAQGGIIFPSHFFEYGRKNQCIDRLEERGLPFFVQVSPGAELRDYLPELQSLAQRSPNLRISVELVFDRSPHSGDWEIIEVLKGMGLSFRYVYCPIKEIQALETVNALPREIYENLYFYFAPKLNRYDSLISPDEIVLLISSLRENMPELPIRVVNHLVRVESRSAAVVSRVTLDLAALERDFRQDPQFEFYLKNYSKLGQVSWARNAALGLSRRAVTAPFISLFYWFLMLLKSPPQAAMVFLMASRNFFLFASYSLRHQIRQLFLFARKTAIKTYFFFRGVKYKADVFSYRSWHIVYFSVRNSLAQLAIWMIIRVKIIFFFLRRLAMEASFRTWHTSALGYFHALHMATIIYYALKNPMWAIEQRSPRTYRIIGYPLVKFFWFSKYQIEKRLLGRHRGEA